MNALCRVVHRSVVIGGLLLAWNAHTDAADASSEVEWRWNVSVPMRDGVALNATTYVPANLAAPTFCVFTLTPYVSDTYHERGMYFARHGVPFVLVDSRGRGNSGGRFDPFRQEAHDGADVVEWLAMQPYCNGKVSMWGGSYAGYDQWMTATQQPVHLSTIVPVASPFIGTDFPRSGFIFDSYDLQWLTYTSGSALQIKMFSDGEFWLEKFARFFESGAPFRELDRAIGNPSPIFQEWLRHPGEDAFWKNYNPTDAQYASMRLPVLTITGIYDGDQRGALTHYRRHLRAAGAGADHYLVIGPWDHAGTRTPSAEFEGLQFGPESLVDLPKLHLDWYRYVMGGGPRPEFLRKRVAYYVCGAEEWKYAESLEAVTARREELYLSSSNGEAAEVFRSGHLGALVSRGTPDRIIHDPGDLSFARVEAVAGPGGFVDQRGVMARGGRMFIYHSAPFAADTEVSGFFGLDAWIGIDRPDADLQVDISEIRADGSSIFLTGTRLRARYRAGGDRAVLIKSPAPLLYKFGDFTFVSRRMAAGSRLRLSIGPVHSIFSERNMSTGGDVADETLQDARPVALTLYHDRAHASVLRIPIGRH